YGLITAGFVHRAGRTASAADAQITDARVEEHRNLGIAFYKTGMLDEATREFRRVAELRAGEADALFSLGLVALKSAQVLRAVGGGLGAEAGRLRGRRRPPGSGAGAVRQSAAAGLVLGARAQRCGGGGVRARRGAGRGGGGGLPVARRAPEQPGSAEGARGRLGGGRGRSARGTQERALAPPAVQEPRRPGVSRVALRRGLGRLPARGGAGARSGRRRVLQARQHRLQAERP